MADPFIGEIRMFGGTFAPQGWAMCNGQILSIAQNTALFSLIGTTYGGNGQDTFALPNLQSRIPLHQGQGAGLSPYTLGETGGLENVTLNTQQIPAHSHSPATAAATGNAASPSGAFFASSPAGQFTAGPANAGMNTSLVGSSGGSQPHPNLMPYLAVNFIIALQGIFPSRS